MTKIFTFFLFLLFCVTTTLWGQSYRAKENSIWIGGSGGSGGWPAPWIPDYTGGLDFNSGAPENIRTSWNKGYGQGAAISDKSGRLLFYTDGNMVWQADGDVMQNGNAILDNSMLPANAYFLHPENGRSGFTQDGVVIVPMPGSSHKYYIFSSPKIFKQQFLSNGNPWYPATWDGKLYYTIVDMEANNGNGMVLSEYSGLLLDDSVAGNLEAVTGENCNIWLLGYGSEGYYKAFEITAAGINTTPVISNIAAPLSATVSMLVVSPNREKAAMSFGDYVEFSDFDVLTGTFSNPVNIGSQYCRSMAFSPDNSKFYIDGLIGLRQYETYSLTSPLTLLTFNNYSAYELDSPLKLAPDGKIYFTYLTQEPSSPLSNNHAPYAACIQQPNLAGAACQMELLADQDFPMLKRYYTSQQFTNDAPILPYDTVTSTTEVPLCFGNPAMLYAEDADGTDYHWMVNNSGYNFFRQGNDSTTSIEATQPGVYAVQYFTSNPCLLHRDTFIVKKVEYSLYLGADTFSCAGEPIALGIDLEDAERLWSDGSVDDNLLVEESGTYWVEVRKDGCTGRDSIDVKILDVRQDLGPDTVVCMEDPELQLEANAVPGASYRWNTGSMQPALSARDSGVYWVEVSVEGCRASDSIRISQQYCDCPMLMPNAFSPNGDGVNDFFKPSMPGSCPVEDYQLQIFNRYGQMIFASYRPEQGWDGRYNQREADAGTYFYQLRMRAGLERQELQKSGEFILMR